MSMTPRVTLILKRASSTIRGHRALAKKIGTRWRQEFKERERERESVCGHDMVTGVHEEVTYCPLSTSSGKEKQNRSTNQPQFCSENTPATVEADQILLALQQLANNNNSAIFHNNINRISKLPKSLTTTMTTFDGKSEKSEDLFQSALKIHKQLTGEDRNNFFPFSHEGRCITDI